MMSLDVCGFEVWKEKKEEKDEQEEEQKEDGEEEGRRDMRWLRSVKGRAEYVWGDDRLKETLTE
ncbi:hypothetical protein E2C01_070389 [Portunus trituberculatus]|uniref:Uncharacterized protein n=1 Tax=Portunus trituberculatus TaxID=210409 RepID=A0A5B7I546_PORTR|nr:hypothetical protein [Portunus trituberculatus]